MYKWSSTGSNADGLLLSDPDGLPKPDQSNFCVISDNGFADTIVVGARHAFLCYRDGCLRSFGANDVGQCGQQRPDVHARLAAVDAPAATRIVVGWQHSAILDAGGHVLAFGSDFSAAGSDATLDPAAFGGHRVTSVACTEASVLALTEAGHVYGWGSAKHGLIPGVGPAALSTDRPSWVPVPQLLADVSDVLSGPAAGGDEAAGTTLPNASTAGDRITQLVGGWHHAAALTSTGRVITWGSNKWGQCGRAVPVAPSDGAAGERPTRRSASAAQILPPGFMGLPWTQAGGRLLSSHSGWAFMVAVVRQDDRDAVYSWGRADMGQLGRPVPPAPDGGRARFDHVPRPVALHCAHASGQPTLVSSLACGSEHCVAALTCGCVWAWGWNEHGNLGTGDTQDRHEPTAVAVPGVACIHDRESQGGVEESVVPDAASAAGGNVAQAAPSTRRAPRLQVACGGAVTYVGIAQDKP